MSESSNNYGTLSADYDAGFDDGRDTTLERVRGILSTPGLSGADVYDELASWLDSEGFKVYNYDDPNNPYASEAMTHTIRDNGIDSSITEEQAERLLRMEAIYACGDCEPLDGETIYHVAPDTELENAYRDSKYPFEDIA